MTRRQLARLGGRSAVLAGGLRLASTFWTPANEVAVESLYLVVDILILFGILGIYVSLFERAGALGFTGFVLAAIGAAVITGPDGRIGAVDMYSAGALALGVGLVLLGIASWRPRTLPRWVAVFWIVSVVSGVLGSVAGFDFLLAAAGVTFALGLMGAGAHVTAATRMSRN